MYNCIFIDFRLSFLTKTKTKYRSMSLSCFSIADSTYSFARNRKKKEFLNRLIDIRVLTISNENGPKWIHTNFSKSVYGFGSVENCIKTDHISYWRQNLC